MAATLFNDEGWSYKLSLPGTSQLGLDVLKGAENAGLVMYDLAHQGHYLATDVRVANLWIEPGSADEKKLQLGLADFELHGELFKRPDRSGMSVSNALRPPYQFSDYPPVAFIQASFLSREAIDIAGNKLLVTQTYILTAYGSTPAHEPGGVLAAARLFPLVWVNFLDPDGKPTTSVVSVRVDYRLGLSLDVFLNATNLQTSLKNLLGRESTNAELAEVRQRPQQGALFHDSDETPSTGAGFGKAISKGTLFPTSVASLLTFDRAEKPVLYEAFVRGKSEASSTVKSSWDNVHWWGGLDWRSRKKDDASITGAAHSLLPSTPGAPFALHLHWRWGKALQLESTRDTVPHAGERQFGGTGVGGFLVDPNMGDQRIEIVIAKKDIDMAAWSNAAILRNLQTARRSSGEVNGLPERIGEGTPLHLWYCITVMPKDSGGGHLGGTCFSHGVFFAHETEETADAKTRYPLGSTDPIYLPSTSGLGSASSVPQTWTRE